MTHANIRLAIVGYGKIARDQHVPAVAATSGIELVAVADPVAQAPGLPSFASLRLLLEQGPEVDAVAVCTPPQGRHALAVMCLRAGKSVLLEKPPGASVTEVQSLSLEARGRTVFAAWHSRYAAAVEPARALLADCAIRQVRIVWKEDVRVWHPGQAWIWEPGGLGVFDPGINALSILTRIMPRPPFLARAALQFPANRDAPIAAVLELADAAGVTIAAEFDWRQTGPQSWDILVETDRGRVALGGGGRTLSVDGETLVDAADTEYRAIYDRFVGLIGTGESDVDLLPLQLVADAFLLGRRGVVEPFAD